MNPLVSVVIPCYNHEGFVSQALESVFEQDYNNLEIIIIDDYSRDNTFAICNEFSSSKSFRKRFQRVTLIQNEQNQGAPYTLNRGAALAQGKYISFLNSDDIYHSERVSGLIAETAVGEAKFLFSLVQPIDLNGLGLETDVVTDPIRKLLERWKSDLPSLSFGFLGKQLAISTGNFFIEKSLFFESGGFADIKYCHDWDLALQLVLRSEPVLVEKELYQYRQHAENSYRSLAGQADLDTEYVLRRYFRSLRQGKLKNPSAPSAAYWPGVFEHFMRKYGVDKWWQLESGAYDAASRTVDHALLKHHGAIR